jgi:uncharacterized protein (DUF952 family)
MTQLLHITERDTWRTAEQEGEYRMSTRGVTLEQEGFIHCSLPHQLRAVAELFYGDANDLVVLVIDSEQVRADIRYEAAAPGGERYPHIYGALPVGAVSQVISVGRDGSGRMILPD